MLFISLLNLFKHKLLSVYFLMRWIYFWYF